MSAPAGGGKTTLAQMLTKEFKGKIVQSISCTTRKPRLNEKDGKDYHFLSKEEFFNLASQDKFLEYAPVFDHYYGTLKEDVNYLLNEGKHVLLVIDTQGAMQIKKKAAAIFIFVVPPSMEELKERLIKRGTEDENSIKQRLAIAKQELEMSKEYDYVIMNQDLSKAYEELKDIIIKEIGEENL
ncbi:MAG: guanylate kinase [Chlamydiales bacterium]|nr:guanylate kinase [Chlamydiales bacterium]